MNYPHYNFTNHINYLNGRPAMRYVLLDCISAAGHHSKAYFCLPTNMCYIDDIGSNGRKSTAFIVARRSDDIIDGKKTFTINQSSQCRLDAIITQYAEAIDYLANNSKYTEYHHYSQNSLKATTRFMHDSRLPHIGTIHIYSHQPDTSRDLRLAAYFRNKGASYNAYLGKPGHHQQIRDRMTAFIRRTRRIKDVIDVGAMELLNMTNPNEWWYDK